MNRERFDTFDEIQERRRARELEAKYATAPRWCLVDNPSGQIVWRGSKGAAPEHYVGNVAYGAGETDAEAFTDAMENRRTKFAQHFRRKR